MLGSFGALAFFGSQALGGDDDPTYPDDAPVHIGAEPEEAVEGDPELEGEAYDIGECVMWEEGAGSMVETHVVECAEPHRIEITGEIILDGSRRDYPDDAEWDVVSQEDCSAHNEAYLGGPLDPHGMVVPTKIIPTPSSWQEGSRKVSCGLSNPHPADPHGRRPFTGSVKGIDQQRIYPVGTCLDSRSPTPVICEEEHDSEVTGSVRLADKLVLPAREDRDGWYALTAGCEAISLAYVGHELPEGYGWGTLDLAEASYAAGARHVHCTVGRWEGDDPLRTTGSVRAG